MPWTYRIVDHGEHFALHTVEIDQTGQPVRWVKRAIDFACDIDCGPQGVVSSLKQALEEASNHPVLQAVDGDLAAADEMA